MDTPTNMPADSGGTAKKKPVATPATKYKGMVNKTAPSDDGTQTNGQGLLMVQKDDGSVGPWGNPVKPPAPALPPAKKKQVMSDKAAGNSTMYYPANSQQTKPAAPTVNKSANYF